VQKKET